MKKITDGSFGEIYEFEEEDGKTYILKCINHRFCGLESLIECAIMTQIKDDHLVNAIRIEYDIEKGQTKIVQERAISSLFNYKRKISDERRRRWCWQIVRAIAVLHKNGIVHGDIHSKNILVFNKDLIKVCDFGLSAYISTEDCELKVLSYTPTHRPPEVWLDEGWGFSADIWSLGCTLYELYYNTSLFSQEKITSISQIEIPKFDNNNFGDLLSKLLQIDKRKRLKIDEVINHSYFDKIRDLKINYPIKRKFSIKEYAEYIMDRYGEKYILDLEIMMGIASKIMRQIYHYSLRRDDIIRLEAISCNILENRLLP